MSNYSPRANAIISKPCGNSFASDYFIKMISKIWSLPASCSTIPIGKGFYVSKNHSLPEANKIPEKGPWFINGTFISTQKWTAGFQASYAKISNLPVWVDLPELPVEFQVEKILKAIGNRLGSFVKADMNAIIENKMRFASMLVMIDVSLPKKESIWLGNFKQTLIFKDWPKFCEECSMVDRHNLSCSLRPKPTVVGLVEKPPNNPPQKVTPNNQKSLNVTQQEDRGWNIVQHKAQRANPRLKTPSQSWKPIKRSQEAGSNSFLALSDLRVPKCIGKENNSCSYSSDIPAAAEPIFPSDGTFL